MSERMILPMPERRSEVTALVAAVWSLLQETLKQNEWDLDRNQTYKLSADLKRLIDQFDKGRTELLNHLERAVIDNSRTALPQFIRDQWPNAVAADFSDPEMLKITELFRADVRTDYRGQPMPAVSEYNPLNGIPVDRE